MQYIFLALQKDARFYLNHHKLLYDEFPNPLFFIIICSCGSSECYLFILLAEQVLLPIVHQVVGELAVPLVEQTTDVYPTRYV